MDRPVLRNFRKYPAFGISGIYTVDPSTSGSERLNSYTAGICGFASALENRLEGNKILHSSKFDRPFSVNFHNSFHEPLIASMIKIQFLHVLSIKVLSLILNSQKDLNLFIGVCVHFSPNFLYFQTSPFCQNPTARFALLYTTSVPIFYAPFISP